jgi:PPP family 3-phenylpropionic acid transporter
MQPSFLLMPSSLFIKLSASYFWYFGLIGLFMPFASVFLDDQKFTSSEIGKILALATATKILGPSIWAKLADKTGNQVSIIRSGAILSWMFFTALYWANGFWATAFFIAMFSLFSAAILPQIEVYTQTKIRKNAKIYARVRLWGSLGFVFVAIIGGELIDLTSPKSFIFLGSSVLLCFLFTAFCLKHKTQHKRKLEQKPMPIFDHLKQKNVIAFFIVGILLQISFGPYYNFFALYLRDLHYPSYSVGLFMGVSIVAEILVFVFAGKIFKYINIKIALQISLALTALRWFMLSNSFITQYTSAIFIAQLLHAAGFALYHCASILFLQQNFLANQQSRAQAIYIGGVYGIGGAVGAYFAGIYWQDGTGSQFTLLSSALIAFIGFTLLALFFKNQQQK